MNPRDRRLAAMGAINTKWTDDQHRLLVTMDNRHEVADDIFALQTLGRTDRWRNAVCAWAWRVKNAEDDAILRWAFFQYGVYAGWAA